MKTAYVTLLDNTTEEVNNVYTIDFNPTHVVFYMPSGNIVAYQANDVKIVVTEDSE